MQFWESNSIYFLICLVPEKSKSHGKYFITVAKLLIRTLLRNNGFCEQNETNLRYRRAIQSN